MGLDAGDAFPSASEAAGDVLNSINPTSINQNLEYGGHIVKNADGTYSATNPIQGGPAGVRIGPPPIGAEGSYHTHGAYDPRYKNEVFSVADIIYNTFNGLTGFLGTPGGAIRSYNGAASQKGLTCPTH